MAWSKGYVAADWGTSNRRAYLIGPDGALNDEMEDDRGILSVPKDGFPEAVAEIRARFGDLPMLLAGMIGSNRGWAEAPYIPCPAGLPELANRLLWVEEGRVAIVPGVAYAQGEAADVMRGEEVQILGAAATGLAPRTALVCHPGTHNKWIETKDGRITDFRTVMTGEIFNLLREHSILREWLQADVEPNASFEAGVRHGLENDDLTAELFSVRARQLLGRAKVARPGCYISGLLIGSDVKIGLRQGHSDEVVVMGRPELTELYAAAIRIAGRVPTEVDGEEAFLAGIRHLAELIP